MTLFQYLEHTSFPIYSHTELIQKFSLRVAHLKYLVGSHLLCDSFLSWIACKISRESHEAFCVQYLEGFIGCTWNERLKNNFLKIFGNRTNVKSIILLLRVGRYIDKRGNYKTFICDYYDENGARSISRYYSFFVYLIGANWSFSCDSLGWEKPPELEKNARDLIYLLLDIKPSFIINEIDSHQLILLYYVQMCTVFPTATVW